MNVSAGLILGSTFLGAVAAASALAAAERTASSEPAEAKTSAGAELSESPRFLHDERQMSQDSVTLGGRAVGYQAEAGVMVVRLMPDLAVAMKQNPKLKVQLNGGYYDLATPYFAAIFELHQLPLEASLQENIEMHFYTSGHMVYAHEPDLKALHANVAAFIEKTKNGRAGQ